MSHAQADDASTLFYKFINLNLEDYSEFLRNAIRSVSPNFFDALHESFASLQTWYQLQIAMILAGIYCPHRFVDQAIDLLTYEGHGEPHAVRSSAHNLLIGLESITPAQYSRIHALSERSSERASLLKALKDRVH